VLNGIAQTARTLSYYLRRQEAAAENVAQASTQGYKAVRVAAEAASADGAPEAVSWTDWEQGTLRETGRPLDVAFQGNGFLVVQTPEGERLSRGGALNLDAGGRLVDTEGRPVLGEQGPIYLAGGSVEVQPNGTVLVDGRETARLRVETVPDLSALTRQDGGIYKPSGKTTAVPRADVDLRQGRLEDSNVDPVLSMVDLIGIHRAFAANAQALKVVDRVLEIAATEVGDA
jgi:flagellar basal-body rod protein FlgF